MCYTNAVHLDNFLVPMQCAENSGCFHRVKWAAIERLYPASPPPTRLQCFRDSIPPAVRLLFYDRDGYGIFFHPYARRGVRHNQDFSLHKCWLGGIEKNCPIPCSTKGPNPGSSDWNSDAVTNEPCPPFAGGWNRVVHAGCYGRQAVHPVRVTGGRLLCNPGVLS